MTTLLQARWEIRARDGSLAVRGDLRALKGPPPRSAVILCHGFKGFREWGFFPSVARAIARRGHAAIGFDLSRNGIGDDGVAFSALHRFAEQTHSGNIAEIRRVIDAVTKGGLFPRPPAKIALLGHSRGGMEALLAASEDDRVDALATWAATASVEDRWSAEQIARWERGETVTVANARTGQEMPIGPAYWRDVLANRDRLDATAAAQRLSIPWLILHGEADETVAVAEAQALFDAAGPNAELCLVEGASHTFGAVHPYTGAPAELRTAVQTTLAWLDEQLA